MSPPRYQGAAYALGAIAETVAMAEKNGLGGFWATQILPFADAVSFTGYMQFETALYQSLRQQRAA